MSGRFRLFFLNILSLFLFAPFSGLYAADMETYATIAPILNQRCVMCHSGAMAAAGLGLDSYDAIMKGGSRGAVVKSGQPAASELIRRMRGTSKPRMPMTGPPYLTEAEINRFERWISAGLPRGKGAKIQPASGDTKIDPATVEVVGYQHVAPIFARRCVKCHSKNGQMGPAPEGYLLNSYAATISSTDRVRVIPGNAMASELVRRIRGYSRPKMPFDGPPYLTKDEISLIERWINEGARDAQGKKASIPVGAEVRLHGELQSHWNVDGLDLIVTGRTRIDKSPRPGDHVQIRGHVDENGNIRVYRLRRR